MRARPDVRLEPRAAVVQRPRDLAVVRRERVACAAVDPQRRRAVRVRVRERVAVDVVAVGGGRAGRGARRGLPPPGPERPRGAAPPAETPPPPPAPPRPAAPARPPPRED